MVNANWLIALSADEFAINGRMSYLERTILGVYDGKLYPKNDGIVLPRFAVFAPTLGVDHVPKSNV